MLNPDAIYKKNEERCVSRSILDEVVIMPLCRSEDDMQYIYSISDEAGSRIWQMLDGRHSIREIQDVLKKEFRGKAEEIEGDVLTFIDDLLSVKLIEKSTGVKSSRGDVKAARDKTGVSGRKRPYKTPELTKVRMQPEQAVLSCCTVNPTMKNYTDVHGSFLYCAAPCQPTSGCRMNNYEYGGQSASS